MLSELGNKVFRHVGLPPEHDFQWRCPLLRAMRVLLFLYPSWNRAPLDMLGEPPVSTLRQRASHERSIALLAKGLDVESRPMTRVYILNYYFMPKSGNEIVPRCIRMICGYAAKATS